MAEEFNNATREVEPNLILTQTEKDAGYELNPAMGHGRRKVSRRYGNYNKESRWDNSPKRERTKLYMAKLKASIANLWNQGIYQDDIAEMVSDEFGLEGEERLNTALVSHHVRSMLNYWRDQSVLSIDEKQSALLARYDQIDALATQAYFLSMQGKATYHEERQIKHARERERIKDIREELHNDNVKLTKKERKALLGTIGELEDALSLTEETIKEYSRMEETAPGDVKFLRVMIECNDRRAQLWGLKNRKEAATGDQELAKLSDDQRYERLAAIFHAAATRKTGDRGTLAPPSPLGGFEGDDPTAKQDEVPMEEAPEEINVESIPEIEDESEDDLWDF